MGLSANDISMARLLTQLFEVTAQFNMQTQPQLLLLQKTMVVVEGVARTLNPDLNIWVTAEPVVRGWIERKLGPAGKLEAGVQSLGRIAISLPSLFEDAAKASTMLSDMAQAGGLRLDRQTTEELARAEARFNRPLRYAVVVGAIALVVIAVSLLRH